MSLEPPKLARKGIDLIEDKSPTHTQAIKNLYVKNILGGIALKKLNPVDENHFRNAGFLLEEFFILNKFKINVGFGRTPFQQAEFLFSAIEEKTNDFNNVSPFWLDSEKTFNFTLPQYLHSQNILNDGE